MKLIAVCILRFYKIFISPFFPASCRFYPTCSEYALEAIKKHGIMAGVKLSLNRLLHCHPFHPGGYDPVP